MQVVLVLLYFKEVKTKKSKIIKDVSVIYIRNSNFETSINS